MAPLSVKVSPKKAYAFAYLVRSSVPFMRAQKGSSRFSTYGRLRLSPIREYGALLLALFILSYGIIQTIFYDPAALSPKGGEAFAEQRNIFAPPKLKLNANGIAVSEQFPGYLDVDPTSQADLCFFIQLSGSSLPMAPRLVARLWHPRNVILLHIDAKASEGAVTRFKAALSAKGLLYANLHILERETITYKGITMLLNTLSAMEYALSLPQRWDYFINLSGADYPLVSVRNMRILYGQPRALKQRVSFVQLSQHGKFWENLKHWRYEQQFVDPALGLPPHSRANTSLIAVPRRAYNYTGAALKVDYAHGESWITAHRQMVLAAARGAYGRRLLSLLARSQSAPEHFFAMLAWNTALNRTTAQYAARAVFWEKNGTMSGQHPFDVDADGDIYAFLGRMTKQGTIFARKFSKPDSPLMDRIDAQLAGVAPNGDAEAVASKFLRVLEMNMCSADIERQWKQATVNSCFYR